MSKLEEYILSDLQNQWNDHFHMRDQTWKTLNYSILIFLGVVGLDFSGKLPLLPSVFSFVTVAIVSLLGFFTAKHHRKRQREKFKMIAMYEKKLGLYELKKTLIQEKKRRFLFTAAFIEGTHIFMLALQLVIVVFKAL